MPTTKLTATQDAWTKLTNGEAAALIQLGTNGPVKIRKQITDPDPSDTDGLVMNRNGLGTLAFDALGGENLYFRAMDIDAESMLVIT